MYQNDTLNNPVYPTRARMKWFSASTGGFTALYMRALYTHADGYQERTANKAHQALQEGPGAPFISQPI